MLVEFNARMQGCYQNDITTFEGCKNNFSVRFEPNNKNSNLMIYSGVHPSLHPNCQHQIVFAKFNLTIFYPPPYKRLVWHYQQANTDLIKRAIELFDCLKKSL